MPLVEGQAEVESMPVLLRRALARLERFDLAVARPIRFKRNKITKAEELRRTLAIGERDRAGSAAFLLVMDADDDCPKDLAATMTASAREMTPLPVEVVIANRELEAWFLGSVESLKASGKLAATCRKPATPEAIRDAKGALRDLLPVGKNYHEVGDQPAFVESMDYDETFDACRSFRRFDSAVRALVKEIPVLQDE